MVTEEEPVKSDPPTGDGGTSYETEPLEDIEEDPPCDVEEEPPSDPPTGDGGGPAAPNKSDQPTGDGG